MPLNEFRHTVAFIYSLNILYIYRILFSFRSVRAISIARLYTSPYLHLRPIYVIVSDDPLRDLILKLASCLDAFSTYPTQTLLLGNAPDSTTDTQEVCPTRSSRTSVGSPQISYAHNR